MEESQLENYFRDFFTLLGSFAWDKAKEFVEKEKLAEIPTPLQTALVTLSQNEKNYASLLFLEQKWFGRKESYVKSAYLSLQTNLTAIEKQEKQNAETANKDNVALIRVVCEELVEFCSARLCCISTYHHILKSLLVSTDGLRDQLEMAIELYQSNISCPCMEILKECLIDELSALLSLFTSYENIASWKYVDSIHSIEEAAVILQKWKPLLAKNQSTFRTGFFGFGEKANNPTSAVFVWLEKLFNALVSKFTFYFYDDLNKHTTADEMKIALSKTSYDFMSKSAIFAKKNDIRNMSLFMETKEEFAKDTDGEKATENIVKTTVYRELLSLPQTCNPLHTKLIESILIGKREDLIQDKLIHFTSGDKSNTFFCAQIDPLIYILICCNGQKQEKDQAVASFVNDIVIHSRLKRVALLIKPGNK